MLEILEFRRIEKEFVIGTRNKGVDMDELVRDIENSKEHIEDYVLKDALNGLPVLSPKKEKIKQV